MGDQDLRRPIQPTAKHENKNADGLAANNPKGCVGFTNHCLIALLQIQWMPRTLGFPVVRKV